MWLQISNNSTDMQRNFYKTYINETELKLTFTESKTFRFIFQSKNPTSKS